MSEGNLDKIIAAVEESALNGVEGFKVDETGEIEIKLLNGKTLNNYLPPDVQLLVGEYDFPKHDLSIVLINPDKLGNPYYLAMLAHELGHVVNGDNQRQIRDKEKDSLLELFSNSFVSQSIKHKLVVLNKVYSTDLLLEDDAWNNGKIIADLMGVDQLVYEETMVDGIGGHYSADLYELYLNIQDKCSNITDDTIFDLYNPYSHSQEKVTYKEFKKKAEEAIELNRKYIDSASKKII